MEQIKYITNKELLAEIHRSKLLFCSFVDPDHGRFDEIVTNVNLITPEVIESARARRAKSLSTKQAPVDAQSIDPDSLVYRVMTAEHVPHDPNRKRRSRTPGEETLAKTPFPAFKHYKLVDGAPVEVLRSHWKGGIENGHFSIDNGKISNRLATMMMLLVERYARRGNWRGYTYNDEMRSHALLQLSQIGLQFCESKSDNPFAFYTQVVKNCFTRVLHLERRNQSIRDDLLIMAGANPSFSRQITHEMQERMEEQAAANQSQASATPSPLPPEGAPAPKKRGRKPKSETV